MHKIIILDFGGQYCHLIARRVREVGVFAEIIDPDIAGNVIKSDQDIKGIILSGGAHSVYARGAHRLDKKILTLGIPILGICYGHQLLAFTSGGKVKAGRAGEYGKTNLEITRKNNLFAGLSSKELVWMNHGDIVTDLPCDFQIIARSKFSAIAAYQNRVEKIYGVQFHPEVAHTKSGRQIFANFVFNICHCDHSWSAKHLIDNIIAEAKTTLGAHRAIIGLSGGIDSTVAAMLTGKAIGKNLIAVYVDTGLMRYGETETIKKIFANINVDLKIVQAQKTFFHALKGVVSPERKRKIIGKLFINIFEDIAKKENADFLIQGTIYSDRIESGITKNSVNIKSHHNVGGLPKNLKLKLYEPLRELYKDEVRLLARLINVPLEIRKRQIFPGPGMAVRILGEITPKKANIVRLAGKIIEEELQQTPYWKKIWMSFAVLLPIKSVGIQGDQRSYKHPIVLRIIESNDAMTANFSHLPYEILEKISTRITNEIKEINRVVYDITNKPPATMEWE